MTQPFVSADKADALNWHVATSMAKATAVPSTPEPLLDPSSTVDQAAFAGQLNHAVRSLRDAGVREEEFDPDTLQIVTAAFRQGNTIGSAISSKSLAEKLFPSADDRMLTDEELIEMIKADGLAPSMGNFRDVFTVNQYEARKADLAKELEDRKILAASGFTGVTASLAAGILDLPTVIPAGRLATVGKVANTLKATQAGAVAATVDAAVTEVALQGTQELRTGEESAINIGSSTVLGGVLGFSIHKAFGNEIADRVVNRLDTVRKDAITGFESSRDAGAKALSVYEQIKERNLSSTAPVFSAGAFGSLQALGNIGRGPISNSAIGQALDLPKLTGWLGDNLRNPRIDLENGMTPEERDIVSRLTFSPSITVRQAEGAANAEEGGSVGFEAPQNVAAIMSKWQGEYVQSVHEIENLYRRNAKSYANIDDFSERVARALASGDRADDPIIQQAANIARSRVLEPIRKQLVANGNFQEEMSPRNAISYFPLVHDVDRIRADQVAWLEYHEAAFLRDIQEEVRAANVERNARRSDRADVKIGARTEKKTDIGITRSEHDENIRSISVERKKVVKEFEDKTKADRKALADARADELATVKTKFDEELSDLKDAQDELLGGSLVDKEQNIRLGSDFTPNEKRQLKISYERDKAKLEKARLREEKDVEKRFGKELDKLNTTAARDRKDITRKFDDQERTAREARDKAIADAQAKAGEANDAASELGGEGGLSILRLNTLAKQEAEAAKRAKAFYDTVTGNTRFILDHEVKGGLTGYAKFRANPAWHVSLMEKGWVKTNALDILEHYVRNAGTDASMGAVFKRSVVTKNADGAAETKAIGDVGLVDAQAAIRKAYDKLIGSARFDEAAKLANIEKAYAKDTAKLAKKLEAAKQNGAQLELKLVNTRDRAIENVKALHRFAKGNDLADGSSDSWRNAAEVMGAFNFLRLMGGTVASSLGDPVNLVIANGFGRTMRHGIVPMLKNFGAAMKNADGDMRRLSRLAMANAEAELNSRIGTLADIGNPYAKATPAVTFMRNASKVFSKGTGIQFWNSFWKQVAFNTTQARIVQNSVAGWSNLSKAERAWSLNLGINEEGLAKIKAAFETQEGSKFVDGTDLPIAAFDKWADREAGELIRSAAHAESHNAVVTPHFSDKLRMSGTPIGRLILQFRNFMFANQMRVIGRNIQLAHLDDARSKRLGVYSGLFGLVMAGAMVDGVKQMLGNTTITGGSVDPDHSSFDRVVRKWQQAPGSALYSALDRSSVLGIVLETSNMAEKLGLPNIRGGMSAVLGDDPGAGHKGASRFANRGVFESVLGPSVGLIEDTAKVGSFITGLGDVYLGSNEGTTFNRSDWRRVRRLMPGQNAPVIQQLLNEGEAYMGTIFDWPSPTN